jgi:hypothetical protein
LQFDTSGARPIGCLIEGVCMSHQASTAVLKHSQTKGSARLLLLAMANYAGPDGSGIYPTLKTLCGDTKLSERAVRYLLRQIEESGELRRDTEGGGKGNANRWTIMLVGADVTAAPTSEDVPRGQDQRGQTLPPLAKTPKQQRGQPSVPKGAKSDTKGAIAVAPEQPKNNQEREESSTRASATSPIDDDEVSFPIVRIYRGVTGNRPTAKDLATARRLAHVDIGLATRTIGAVFGRAGGRVSSLAYFEQEILDEHAEAQCEGGFAPAEPAAPDVAIDDVAAAKQRVWAQAAVILARNPKISRRELRLELTLWCADHCVGLEVVDLCYPPDAKGEAA